MTNQSNITNITYPTPATQPSLSPLAAFLSSPFFLDFLFPFILTFALIFGILLRANPFMMKFTTGSEEYRVVPYDLYVTIAFIIALIASLSSYFTKFVTRFFPIVSTLLLLTFGVGMIILLILSIIPTNIPGSTAAKILIGVLVLFTFIYFFGGSVVASEGFGGGGGIDLNLVFYSIFFIGIIAAMIYTLYKSEAQK